MWSAALTPRKPAPPVIRTRRARRLVVAGARLDAGLDVASAPPATVEPDLGEVVARIVDVIEVPYVKPIKRRRPYLGCPLVSKPAPIKATLPSTPRQRVAVREATQASPTAIPVRETPPPCVGRATVAPLGVATVAGGAIAGCGYFLGAVVRGGLDVLAGSLVIALALIVAFVIATGSARLVVGRGRRIRAKAAQPVAMPR